jgi:transposase
MKHEMHVLGIDIAKHVLHAVGMDERGNVVYRKRVSRHDLMPCIAKLPPVRIGIEACGGAHSWARRFRASGHEVKRMAPQCVKPYVKSNKNASRDAEAIAEAVTRPTRRFVPIKDVDQQDIQALHRVRERLIGERTALGNAVHGLLHEYGIVIPKGVAKESMEMLGIIDALRYNDLNHVPTTQTRRSPPRRVKLQLERLQRYASLLRGWRTTRNQA